MKDAAYYRNMVNHFLWMIRERKHPVSLENTLEIIRILVSAKKSLETGREVVFL